MVVELLYSMLTKLTLTMLNLYTSWIKTENKSWEAMLHVCACRSIISSSTQRIEKLSRLTYVIQTTHPAQNPQETLMIFLRWNTWSVSRFSNTVNSDCSPLGSATRHHTWISQPGKLGFKLLFFWMWLFWGQPRWHTTHVGVRVEIHGFEVESYVAQ